MRVEAMTMARMVLAKACEDGKVSDLEYDVYYHNDVIEGDVKSFRVEKEGFEITMEVQTDIGSYCLFTLEPSEVMWEAFGGYADNWELQFMHKRAYDVISERCRAVFPAVLDELETNYEKSVVAKYAVLAVGGPLGYSPEKICDCGDFTLAQYENVLLRGECSVALDVISDIAADYLMSTGLRVVEGNVILYQIGDNEPVAVLLSGDVKPVLCNSGGRIGETMYQSVQTFNYTLDTVGSSECVFLFNEKRVVPIEDIDLAGMCLCVELDWELHEWRVMVSDQVRDRYYDIKGYECFEQAREALKRDMYELSGYVYWSRTPMIEVSPFGMKCLKKRLEEITRLQKEVV